jgi:RND family efflux transporter MFP subunit
MKNLFRLIIGIIIVAAIASCGRPDGLEAKKAELEKLKNEQQQLNEKIAALQSEIDKLDTAAVKSNDKAKLVSVAELQPGVFEHSIDVQGTVDGDENITYSAKAPGVVQRILVKAGQQVSNGQVLAELDNKNVKAQLESLKANYELAKTVFEKQKTLWEQQVGSEIQYLQAKTNKESLEKQIAALRESVDMYTIKADFSGTVDEVYIKVGQNVAPGVPCIRVVNPSSLKIKADISESYASSVNTGNPVRVYFPDINKGLDTRVTYASKAINPMTRTFVAEIQLPSDAQYRPNMLAEVRIIDYKNDQTLVVPVNTIQRIDDTDVVFVAEEQNGKTVAVKRYVKAGLVYNGKAQILEGLKAGDKIITVGFQDLVDGQLINY